MTPGEAERRAAAAVKPRQPELQRGRALLRGHGEPDAGIIVLNNAWLRYEMVREFPNYVFSDYCIYFTEKP